MCARALEALATYYEARSGISGLPAQQRKLALVQAGQQYDRAAATYRDLGDFANAARVYLLARKVLKDVPQDVTRLIRKEPELVRAATIEIYNRDFKNMSKAGGFVANRSALSPAAGQSLLAQARQQVADQQVGD